MICENIEPMLESKIAAEFEKLKELEPGSEEHKERFRELTELTKLAIEIDKVEIDGADKAATRESEQLMKQQQMNDEKKDRVVKNLLSAAGIVLPILVTIWGTKVSLKFEEEGTFTTIMGRGFINKLLPKK